jgi:saccharopine dehydrogenase-like NADP-dependent oxidoreductase
MKSILVLGTGLSATYLIDYLEQYCDQHHYVLTLADQTLQIAASKKKSERTQLASIDVTSPELLEKLLEGNDLVVSMLPARFHLNVARLCLKLGIHLATASYLSNEMQALNDEVKSKDLLFLNECGLDPGIDHLSAMQILNTIRAEGGEITSFESFTGGLVAPDCEDNPWRYKFTWNPRNVVLAGSGGAVRFIHNNQYKYIPYHRVFRRTEMVHIPEYGRFEGYANRDSLKYREIYGLDKVETMYRGTFRRPGFSKAWNCFVQLGATDDSYILENSEHLTNRQFINTFLAYHPTDSIELKLRQYLKIDQDDVDLWEKLVSTGIFTDDKVGIPNATPAQMLQAILEKCWTMKPTDRDMIVMWHKIGYTLDTKQYLVESSLVCEGEDAHHTAMAKTVGLPLAIACKLILENKITQRGCILPIHPEIYTPVLKELESFGIVFKEQTTLS